MAKENLLRDPTIACDIPPRVPSVEPSFPPLRQLNVVSLSIEYPSSAEPGKGLFIRARLQALAGINSLIVLSPVAILDYANPQNRRFGSRDIPTQVADGSATVLYPRWLYPPRGGAFNAFCLFFRLLPVLYKLNRAGKFDLLDAHFVHPDGIAAALAAWIFRKPFIVTARGSELSHQRFRLRRLWMAWALRRAARVIAVAENLREFAVEMGASPECVKVIPNGVDGDLFFPRDRAACREMFGIQQDVFAILSAGDLAEIKGHHRVIRALRKLRDDGINAELLVAGGVGRSGRYAEVLHHEVESHGLVPYVRFLGEVRQHQLAKLMSAADVFCLASSREGCPNVVSEALACGTPVVATDVGAVRRLVPSKQYGEVVPLDSPEVLQTALQDTLTVPRNREAIASWGGRRTWKQVAAEVNSEIRHVLAKNIIINADDLGISERVNDAILELMARKRITSATLMANGPALEDAAKRLRQVQGCSFGVHLNLTEFEPLTPRGRSKLLVDAHGLMRKSNRNAKPAPARLRAMYEELSAQIERLLSLGIPLSHMDSHHHVHTIAYMLPLIKALQRRYGIRKIRLSKNIYTDEVQCSPGLRIKKNLYNKMLQIGSDTTQGFTEFVSFWNASRSRHIEQQTVELMVHPGAPGSEEETALLQSAWEGALPFAVRHVSYHNLPGNSHGAAR